MLVFTIALPQHGIGKFNHIFVKKKLHEKSVKLFLLYTYIHMSSFHTLWFIKDVFFFLFFSESKNFRLKVERNYLKGKTSISKDFLRLRSVAWGSPGDAAPPPPAPLYSVFLAFGFEWYDL